MFSKKPLREKRGGPLSLQDPRMKAFKQFGGSLLKKGNPKVARSLSTKHAMHLVLKSSLATGEYSLRAAKNQKAVGHLVHKVAQKYSVRILEFANAGNHLHLLIQLPKKQAFAPFIRALTGMIAQKIMRASKVRSLQSILSAKEDDTAIRFWDYRPWSRLVELIKSYKLGDDFKIHTYLQQIGMITTKTRDYHRYFKEAPA